jgi:hypothetical protein
LNARGRLAGIRHEQQGEITLMRGATGAGAVVIAFRNMFVDNVN